LILGLKPTISYTAEPQGTTQPTGIEHRWKGGKIMSMQLFPQPVIHPTWKRILTSQVKKKRSIVFLNTHLKKHLSRRVLGKEKG
jgi:hypothetical protein